MSPKIIKKEIMMITEMTPRASLTEEAKIEIDIVTESGSAFGLCDNGDQVFLNSRIVDRMELQEGDICRALLLENFEDKRAITPWRAVRVSLTN